MKNSYKIGKKKRKKQGIVGDDVGGFRVQCAFPNMESIAMLTKNSYKIGKKQGIVGDDVQGVQGPVYISKYGKYSYAK